MPGTKQINPPLALVLLLLAGCVYPVRENADIDLCDLVRQPVDAAVPAVDSNAPAQPASPAVQPGVERTAFEETELQQPSKPTVEMPTGRQGQIDLVQRLRWPSGLPGGGVGPIQLPAVPDKDDPGYDRKMKIRMAAIDQLFPPLPPPVPFARPVPGPGGQPMTLADLQKIALSNNPVIRQAAADVQAARGAVIQSGVYPNPTIGYEVDDAGSGGTAGYEGVYLEQTIKTAGKLKLAQAAATMDLRNAELALRRAQADLVAQVRAGYFGVLVALETMRVNDLLTRFTDTAYQIQVEQLKAGVAAPYEPMQLRVLDFQTRAALLDSRNAYTAAWKALDSTLGRPELRPTELAGRLESMPVPHFAYDRLVQQVLMRHTDMLTAVNGIQKARYNLLLAQVTPVPDPALHLAVQKDYTVPPFTVATSLQLGVPVPVFDHNKGGIIQAQAALLRAMEEPHRVRTSLAGQVADAFNRYQTNVMTLAYYRDQILPDQVRAYQSLRERYDITQGEFTFGDIVTAQQSLGAIVGRYLTTIAAEWTAVVDLAHLLQSNELFEHTAASNLPCDNPLGDLETLLTLPCTHPCNPMPTATPVGVDQSWTSPSPDPVAPAPASGVETLSLPAPRRVGEAKPSPARLDFSP